MHEGYAAHSMIHSHEDVFCYNEEAELCPRGSVQVRRYAENSLLECSFPVTFPPKFVVRGLDDVEREGFGVR